MSDITIDVNGYCINLRVAGIVRLDDQILVCRMIDRDWWFLPGGRIKANESSLQALQRELCEEIGNQFSHHPSGDLLRELLSTRRSIVSRSMHILRCSVDGDEGYGATERCE